MTAAHAAPATGTRSRSAQLSRDSGLIAARDVLHWVHQPSALVLGLVAPIVIVVLFAYVFGSAMTVPGGGNYREFLMVGIYAQTMFAGISETIATVQADTAKGVTDRLRSMPLAPTSIVIGRCLSGMVSAMFGLAVLVTAGLVVGWRPHGTIRDTAGAIALLLVFRFGLLWIGIALGLSARTPETANAITTLILPISMLSNAFVAPELMPDWIRPIAEWNPLSATITATRRLFGSPGVPTTGWSADHAIELAIAWPIILTVLTLPLAAHSYRRLGH